MTASKEIEIDIDQLIPDDKNANKGTKKGSELIEKSFQELGAGRSVLIDKNNRIIAGNKSTDAAKKAGIKNVRIIETDGTELIAVKRTDVDIDSKQGRELAIADNSSALASIEFDYQVLEEIAELEGIELQEWMPYNYGENQRIGEINNSSENDEWVGMPEFNSGDIYFKIVINFKSEQDRETYANENEMEFNSKSKSTWSTTHPFSENVGSKGMKYDVEE